MSIDAISSIQRADAVTLQTVELAKDTQIEHGFIDLLKSNVSDVNNSIVDATDKLEQFALGAPLSTHEVMLALETAKYDLQLSLEIRNKLVESYQELIKMQL